MQYAEGYTADKLGLDRVINAYESFMYAIRMGSEEFGEYYNVCKDELEGPELNEEGDVDEWKEWAKKLVPKWIKKDNPGVSSVEVVESELPVQEVGAPVSNMSAMLFSVGQNELLRKMLGSVSVVAAGMTAGMLADQLSILVHQLRAINPQSTMGVGASIDEEGFNRWRVANAQDVTPVGPYMFTKLLLQAGATWSVWEHPVTGLPHLLLEMNGVGAFCTNRYNITINKPDLAPQQMEEEFVALARGVVISARQVRLVHIPEHIYAIVHGLIMRYDIKVEKDKFSIVQAAKPFFYGPVASRAYSVIVEGLKREDTRPGTAADSTIDWLARMIFGKYPEQVAALKDIIEKATKVAAKDVQEFADSCRDRLDLPAPQKIALLQKLGVNTDVESALRTLRVDREKRNRKECHDISQYVQKNVASVYAPNMMPMFDTHAKLKSVVNRLASLVPAEWNDYPVHVYGVAYDHMGNAVSGLPRAGKVQYFDITKQRQANTVYTDGNVFDMTTGGKPVVVIDDTLVNHVPEEFKSRHPLETNGSLFKLRCIIKAMPDIIATKLDMKAFVNAGAVSLILAQSGYRVVHVSKFGKLHNGEVFVVLSKHGTRVRNAAKVIMGDINCVALTMQVANHVVMMANQRGVTCPITPGQWRDVLCALPVVNMWYATSTTEDHKYSGGARITGQFMDVNVEVSYEGADEGDEAIEASGIGVLDGVKSVDDIDMVLNAVLDEDEDDEAGNVFVWEKGLVRPVSNQLAKELPFVCGDRYQLHSESGLADIILYHKDKPAYHSSLVSVQAQRAFDALTTAQTSKKVKVPKLNVNK